MYTNKQNRVPNTRNQQKQNQITYKVCLSVCPSMHAHIVALLKRQRNKRDKQIREGRGQGGAVLLLFQSVPAVRVTPYSKQPGDRGGTKQAEMKPMPGRGRVLVYPRSFIPVYKGLTFIFFSSLVHCIYLLFHCEYPPFSYTPSPCIQGWGF